MQMPIPFTTLLVKGRKKTQVVPHLSYFCLPAKLKQRFIPFLIGKLLTCQRKLTQSRLSPSPVPTHQSPPLHLMFWKPEVLPLHR